MKRTNLLNQRHCSRLVCLPCYLRQAVSTAMVGTRRPPLREQLVCFSNSSRRAAGCHQGSSQQASSAYASRAHRALWWSMLTRVREGREVEKFQMSQRRLPVYAQPETGSWRVKMVAECSVQRWVSLELKKPNGLAQKSDTRVSGGWWLESVKEGAVGRMRRSLFAGLSVSEISEES